MVQPVLGSLNNIVGEYDLANQAYECAKAAYLLADKANRYWMNQLLNYMQLHCIESVSVNGKVYQKRGNYIIMLGTVFAEDEPTAPPYFPGEPTTPCYPTPTPCHFPSLPPPSNGQLPEFSPDFQLASNSYGLDEVASYIGEVGLDGDLDT